MSFLHNPISDIQSIANNLRDRYKSGFPILKEIVQNADDAKAKNLIIGWHPGIMGCEHPLLKDPGVFFVNDAPLTEADVIGIRTLGLGSKADDTNSVGKFGLGMKSLFHLGEVYFFIGSDWEEFQDKNPNSEYQKAAILNPWDKLREEWNFFSDSDKKEIQEALLPITNSLGDEAYKFIVWIPLRSASIALERGKDSNNYIYNSEDYGRGVPHFLTEPGLAVQLGQLFPMLKQLRTIKGYIFSTLNALAPSELFSVAIEQPTERVHFPNIKGTVEWSGSILVNNSLAESSCKIDYVGNESILESEQLDRLRENKFWPISYERDASGREKKVRDKAKPHSATLLLTSPSSGQAKLTVRWAVFLPLGEQAITEEDQVFSVNIEGDTSFDIRLHGYFFIDAGRVGIHGRKMIGHQAPLVIDSEDTATQEWNRLLANKGTLPMLLPVLALATSKWKLNQQKIESLSWGIHRFLNHNMGKAYHSQITDRYQWVYQLQIESKEWSLVDSSHPVRALPKPNSGEYERIWETFPSLASLSDSTKFIEKNKPNIPSYRNARWQEQELISLFKSVNPDVFKSQKLLVYLADFLKMLNEDSIDLAKPELQSALINMAQAAFKSVPLPTLSRNQSAVREFVCFISNASRFSVKVEKEEQPLWDVFSSVDSSILIIPSFLDASDSKGRLNFNDADRVFTQLGKQELNDNQLAKATDSILSAFKGDEKSSLLQRHDRLKLFSAVGSSGSCRESMANLRILFQKRRLFALTHLKISALGEFLKDALADSNVVFINSVVNQQLFDGRVQPCEMNPLLELLATRPLLKAPKHRADLISKLEIRDNLSLEQKLSIRYLIHGSRDDNSLSKPLWSIGGDHEVWSRLHKNSLSSEKGWTLIPHELASTLKLTPQEKKVINLEEVNANSVLGKLGEDIKFIDFTDIINDEVDAEVILEQIDNAELWRQLPLHRTIAGDCRSLDENCFLVTNIELPEKIKQRVTWITPAASKNVQRQQKDYIHKFDHAALIRLVLKHDDPSEFQDYIFPLIEKLDLTDPLVDMLKQVKWLKAGQLVFSPNMVVNSYQDCWLAVSQLSRISREFCFIDDLDAFQSVGVDRIKHLLVTSHAEIAKLALNAAAKLTDYAVGKWHITFQTLMQACKYREIFTQYDLKGWELLIECYTNAPEGSLTEEQFNQLGSQLTDINKLIKLHQALIKVVANAEEISGLRSTLLAMICSQSNPLQAIAKLTLRSKSNNFIPSNMLCYGIEGVTHSSLLHNDDYNVIKAVIPISHQSSANGDELQQQLQDRNVQEQCITSSAEEIKAYFSKWDSCITNRTAIGAVLALMSGNSDIKNLCESYIGSRSIEQFIRTLGQNWDSEKKSFSTLGEFISKIDFDIRPEDGSTIAVESILGEEIEVDLEKYADSIFVWNTTQLFYSRPISVQLRTISVEKLSEKKLLTILKRSAELFLDKIYQQKLTLDHIWDEFSGPEQLDINAAKLTVLDGIVYQLKELSLKIPKLKDLLNKYDALLSSSAENGGFLNEEKKAKLLAAIGKEVEVASTKEQLLSAIKQKISDAQYEPSSVPFELFQNADDAVIELNELGFPQEEIKQRGVFKVNIIGKELSFLHWGREVNQYSSRYISSAPKISKFKMDLQKMLVRNQSNKEGETTGKFGLGFKSCLLISDKPNIISGRLAVQVEGGLLPVLSPNYDVLFERARSEKIDNQFRPTVISLPLNKDVDANEVLKRFKDHAGLLSVFSKKIHTIECDDVLFKWAPSSSSIKGLAIGHIDLPTKNRRQSTRVAQIDTESGRFVLALNRNGFKPLHKAIPQLWNLAPLMGDFGIGIAINAGFEIDMGRNHLNVASTRNKEIFNKLGRELTSFLEDLYLILQAADKWQVLKEELVLDDEISVDDFFVSLWKALWGSGINLNSEDFKTGDYTSQLFTCENSLLSFYHAYQAFPTNLNTGSHKLVNLSSVKYRTSELLERLLKYMTNLPAIDDLLKNQALVSYDTGSQLLKLGKKLPTLDLNQVLDMTIENNCLPPAIAKQLQDIFNSEFEKALLEQKATYEQIEQFRKKLGELQIKTRNGAYRELKQVLIVKPQASNSDELMVAGFAPDEYIAAESYADTTKLLEFCRRDTTPYKADMLLSWICRKDVQSHEAKAKAICDYLVRGDFGEKLATLVMKYHQPAWLLNVDVKQLERWGWNKKQIDTFRNVRLISDTEVYQRVEQQLRSEGKSHLTTEEALMRIYQWWNDEREVQLAAYKSELYPRGMFDWDSIKKDEQPEVYNQAWLKLFFLGSCQTIGRTKEVQHRAALEHFETKGWWSVFSDVDDPSAWFDVMDQYLKDAVTRDKYRTWLQILPLYRFSSHLDNYIELFWMAEQQMPNIKALIQPGSSSDLSGAGSSFSPPELKATLGIGANFILRELYRHNVYSDTSIEKHCFVASGGVRELLGKLADPLELQNVSAESSEKIYNYLRSYMEEEYVTFGGSFDIPLRILAREENRPRLEKILEIGVWN